MVISVKGKVVSDFDLSNLEYGVKYDIKTKSGSTWRGWYLYDKNRGCFTRDKDTQRNGFIYRNSIESIKESK
ncbi:MAG: hypothetical protein GY782_11865 [Gammaproteobacteria bacterium]|nr:hypothetical protein [Gammaproteobacteria bacterium]